MLLTTWPSLRDDNNDYDHDIMNNDDDYDDCTIVHTYNVHCTLYNGHCIPALSTSLILLKPFHPQSRG